MRDLNEMKYLERVVKEALRLYPSVPFIGRTLQEDTKIGTSCTASACNPHGLIHNGTGILYMLCDQSIGVGKTLLFSKAPGLLVGSTQPPVQWVAKTPSSG
jgi:hypothetical protein